MNKKIISLLIVSLAITALVYMYIKEKKKKQALALPGSSTADTTGTTPVYAPAGNAPGSPTLATQGINGSTPAYPSTATSPAELAKLFPIGIGSTGLLVKMIQAALGLKIDGVYGAKTDIAVKAAKLDVSSFQAFTDNFITVDAKKYAANFPLKKGSKNNYVKAVQLFLGLTPDGVFGVKTETALQNTIGKTVLYHADYVALFAAISGFNVNFNGKKTTPISSGILEKLRNTFGGMYGGLFN